MLSITHGTYLFILRVNYLSFIKREKNFIKKQDVYHISEKLVSHAVMIIGEPCTVCSCNMGFSIFLQCKSSTVLLIVKFYLCYLIRMELYLYVVYKSPKTIISPV